MPKSRSSTPTSAETAARVDASLRRVKPTKAAALKQPFAGPAEGKGKPSASPSKPKQVLSAPAPLSPADSAEAERDEALLRAFDLTTKFGPCSSMDRLQRFLRAERLGLDPPAQVGRLLKAGAKSESLWHGRI